MDVSDSSDIIHSIYALSEKADLGLIILDRNLYISHINLPAKLLLGQSSSGNKGKYFTDIIENGNRIPLMKILKEESYTVKAKELTHFIKGERIKIEWIISPVHTGDSLKGFSICLKDISKLEEQREKMEISEHMIENIFKYAPIGIYQVNHSGNVINANPEFAWMLGYESSKHLVLRIRDIATQMFSDPEKAEEFYFTLLEAEEVNRFRCRLRRSDGSHLWVLSYAKATKNPLGKIDGFFGFSIDITHTVRNEERMQDLNKELKQISMIDGLTKIANRRKFDDYIYKEWKRMDREKRDTISMILCDIDFFKLYNDTYGHQMGDECLKLIASAIKECVQRPTDLAARYGGEEFVLLLPETDIEGARHIAENIRVKIRQLEIEHKSSKISPFVTLSFGTGSIDDLNETPDDLIRKSDLALYKAKEEGRDRVN